MDIVNIVKPIIFIIVAIIVLILVYRFARPYFIKIDTVACFTGAPGTGKDLLGVDYAIAKYRSALREWRIKKFILGKKFNVLKPEFISSIPILLNDNVKKPIFSKQLTLDIIILQVRLPQKSVVYWSDINKSVNQWSYVKPLVKNNIAEFVTQFRHYTKGGYFILNSQSSDLIAKEIRACIGTIYNLIKHNDFLGVVHWITLRRISISESVISVQETKMADNVSNTMRKWLITNPSLRRYDTYAYYGRVADMSYSDSPEHKYMNTNTYIVVPDDDIKTKTGDTSYINKAKKDYWGTIKITLFVIIITIIVMIIFT